MAFKLQSNVIGVPDITATTTIATYGVAGLPSSPDEPFVGETRQGYDIGLGSGEFIFLRGVASLAAGDLVTYASLNGSTFRWDGTANTGYPLAVAVAAVPSTEYGWFQISGNAVINCTGTVAAGDKAFFSATAAIKTAAVNGKQVLNITAATANGATVANYGTLASTQAVYMINRPFVQGQIT
jgi:hypothetical protein